MKTDIVSGVVIKLPNIVTCLGLKWVISLNMWNRLYYGREDGWYDGRPLLVVKHILATQSRQTSVIFCSVIQSWRVKEGKWQTHGWVVTSQLLEIHPGFTHAAFPLLMKMTLMKYFPRPFNSINLKTHKLTRLYWRRDFTLMPSLLLIVFLHFF